MNLPASPGAVLRARLSEDRPLAGTFLKTPAHELVEVLSTSGIDFLCLDAEHSPFDIARMDACLAMGRALGFPLLVRVASAEGPWIGQALDMGAAGIVVPHVTSAELAAAVVKRARYGHGGRGFAGSTRSAGFATRTMAAVLAESGDPVVIAQIEDPEGVEAVAEIASVAGLDGLFLGPADLSVAYGQSEVGGPQLDGALVAVGAAAAENGLAYASFVRDADGAAAWLKHGINMFFFASEHAWMRAGAQAAASGLKALGQT